MGEYCQQKSFRGGQESAEIAVAREVWYESICVVSAKRGLSHGGDCAGCVYASGEPGSSQHGEWRRSAKVSDIRDWRPACNGDEDAPVVYQS